MVLYREHLFYYVGNIGFDIFGVSTESTAERESADPTLFLESRGAYEPVQRYN